MTFEEAEDQLPNGLHDAELLGFHVDLSKQVLSLDFEADLSSPDRKLREDEPASRPVRFEVTGFCYFSLEPPMLSLNYSIDGPAIVTSSEDARLNGILTKEALSRLPEGTFCQRLFLSDWNAFLIFCGKQVRLEFVELAV
jgi:hypothetical protein